jgi:hypothetical protein
MPRIIPRSEPPKPEPLTVTAEVGGPELGLGMIAGAALAFTAKAMKQQGARAAPRPRLWYHRGSAASVEAIRRRYQGLRRARGA